MRIQILSVQLQSLNTFSNLLLMHSVCVAKETGKANGKLTMTCQIKAVTISFTVFGILKCEILDKPVHAVTSKSKAVVKRYFSVYNA